MMDETDPTSLHVTSSAATNPAVRNSPSVHQHPPVDKVGDTGHTGSLEKFVEKGDFTVASDPAVLQDMPSTDVPNQTTPYPLDADPQVTEAPPVYPVLDLGDQFTTHSNKNGSAGGETFDMVPLSDWSSPSKAQLLTEETQFHNHGHKKQASFIDHAIHEDKSQSLLQTDLSSDTVELSDGPGGDGARKAGGEDGGGSVEVVTEEKGLTAVRQLLSLWYVALIFLTPIILLPLPLVVNTSEAKCAYVIFVMAVFWVTEAIPIPVTSLMPIFLLPMMGLLPARQTSAAYINDTSILFLGGLTVAIAIENWNLHRRIALAVMMVVGAKPRWLMLGMMLVTWFLSMWISNTATTAMMLPIVQAVLQQISAAESDPDTDLSGDSPPHYTEDIEPTHTDVPEKPTSKRLRATKRGKKYKFGEEEKASFRTKKPKAGKEMSMKKLGKALSLAIAYSANVGGIASLTGTGPNLVLLGQSQIIFEKVGLNTPITFATWLVYGLPLSLILVFVVWMWLQLIFLRCDCQCVLRRGTGPQADSRDSKVREVIRAEFRKLGPISYAEGTIMVFFGILVVLWITRDLGGSGGWANIFRSGFVSDSTPAILIAVLMFILPSSLPDILFRSRRQARGPRQAIPALMNWKVLHEKMPWSLYLLLGGGFAIAEATQESGLSLWLGEKLSVFGALDPWLMLLIICYIVTFVTEVTSNTAIATIMMPILAQLSLTLNLNPLFFMFPTAITTSFAFMLPVATPPNAIVFAFGAVRVIDMVMCGFMLNVLSVPFLLLATVTWGNAFFNFDLLPPEFINNATLLANTSAV